MTTVEVSGVSKSFGDVSAVRDVSISVGEGEIFGLIGPDGAGKTTLFRILATLLVPDSGEARILGLDVVDDYREIRPLLGYMPGRFSLYEDLTVSENLSFFGSIFGTDPQEGRGLIEDIYSQIAPFSNRRAGALSGGMKQKLALSCALIHRPRILLLDEPTTGVDAVSRREFWTVLGRLRSEGITVIVSTPYMDEASRCDRVALVDHGQLLMVDTPDAVENSMESPLFAVSGGQKYEMLLALRRHPETRTVFPFGDTLHFRAKREIQAADLTNWLHESGFAGSGAVRIQAGIEDVFMALAEPDGMAEAEPDGMAEAEPDGMAEAEVE
jgi:drug efflux transport system ATP-binding protein